MPFHHQKAFATDLASPPTGQRTRLVLKTGMAGLVAVLFGWLLAHRLTDISFDQMKSALVTVAAWQWFGAAFATGISFWAVGHYDGVIHRHLATGISPVAARRAGATAIAVSQTIGFGVITGALLRWRMLPCLSLWQATKLTSLVAVFFLSGWAIVTATAILVLPMAPFKPIAFGAVCLLPVLAFVCAITPRMHRKNWPNIFIMARLTGFAAIDTVAAALALWLLCPPELALPLGLFLPAFLIAFGAGLLSGTPGGVGAFELTVLALLPQIPEAPLLAAILAWRVVYFAAPALIGAGFAIRGPQSVRKSPRPAPHPSLTLGARRAETALYAQGHLTLTAAGADQAWLTGRSPHCLIGLFDPVGAKLPQDSDPSRDLSAITDLIRAARSEDRLAVIYKCSARTAVAARTLGLALRPIAREAWVDPRSFTLNCPSRAGLRRKLRQADRAGLTVGSGGDDGQALAQIAQNWAEIHGVERGFSMGRFDQSYIAGQQIYVASVAGKPVAFASFHIGISEWTLDLMRHTSSAPDGTMHALIAKAIADAGSRHLPRLSLAAVPLAAMAVAPKGRIAAGLHRALGGRHIGLAQFKSAFVPHWQTLYLAAPHKPGLILAGLEIAREVHYPHPLPSSPQHHHEYYEFASAGQAWHRGVEEHASVTND